MTERSPLPRLPLTVVIATWVVLAACNVAMLLLDLRLADAGRSDLQMLLTPSALYAIPILSAAFIGSVLTLRQPRHPVGWLLLLLAITIDGSGLIDGYAVLGAVVRPGALPGASLVAVLGGSTFLPWFIIPTLILLLTPSGRFDDRVTRVVAVTSVLSGVVAIGAGLLRPYNGPLASSAAIHNPLEVSRGADLLLVLRWSGIIGVHIGVLVAAVLTIQRFRAALASDREQLRWVGVAAIPFALCVLGASAAAILNVQWLLSLLAGTVVALIPLGVGLAVARHHLYDVDRLVSQAVGWFVLSAALIVTYVVVVVFVGESLGRAGDSAIPAVVATLAAVSIAGPLRRAIQQALDRRFNRRRFETLAMLRAYTRQPTPDQSVEQALRAATRDPSLAIAYWIGERAVWVSEAGVAATPAADGVIVRRGDEPICVIGADDATVDRATVTAAAAEVLTELDNTRLRAAIALQLVEVRESRARIVETQLAERRRIERNLHDGAQQRLLGLAMQLRAVEVGGDTLRMRSAVAETIGGLQLAVEELRELANGLRPAILADGGLAAALDDLASRSTVPIRVQTTVERFAPSVEETAWFIACEAVTNAVKHASPRSVVISACREADRLRLAIEDDGVGGADPDGSGLRGIADRAEAAGGWLSVRAGGEQGTIVFAELPCGS